MTQVTQDQYMVKEQKLAALRGWASIIPAGQSLLGMPVDGGVRGQGLVPAWCRSWAHCGPLIREYRIALSCDGITAAATCRGNRIVANYADHDDHGSAECFAIVSAIIAAVEPEYLLTKVCKRMRFEILEDIASGRIPSTIKQFSQLHDYVDGDEYGGFCDDEESEEMIKTHFGGRDTADDGMPQAYLQFINDCQANIDSWLATSVHRIAS